MKQKYISQDTFFRLIHSLTSEPAANDLMNAVNRGIEGPNVVNKYSRFVNQQYGSDTTGDGTLGAPFASLDKALASIPEAMESAYTIRLGAGSYAAESGTFVWRNGVNLIGEVASNTTIQSPINLTAQSGETVIIQFQGVAVNEVFTMDFELASFVSFSFLNGACRVNRIDSNPSCIITMQGGIFDSDIMGGSIVFSGGYLFGNVTVQPGASVYATNMSSVGGKYLLRGDAYLKTMASPFSIAGAYVDGEIVLGNTPTWDTDPGSDFGFTGDVTKNIL